MLKASRDLALDLFHQIAGIKEKNQYYVTFKEQLQLYIDKKEMGVFQINDEIAEQ